MADRTFILLLRGINVGGNNLLKMNLLRELVEQSGGTNVKTYIQSGNCILDLSHDEKGEFLSQLESKIETTCNFKPNLLLLTLRKFEAAVANIPFTPNEPKNLHCWFLKEPSKQPNWELAEKLKSNSEEYQLIDQCFYLHAPDGIARSKLAASVEKVLGVAATARNSNSMNKILALAGS